MIAVWPVLPLLLAQVFAWSPDGRRAAYAGEGAVFIAAAPDFGKPERVPLPAEAVHQLLWSPGGTRLAVMANRSADGWQTIFLAGLGGRPAVDLLPAEVSDRFGSPGVRSVSLDAWLNEREIAFSQGVGTGAVALYKVDVHRREYSGGCVASVDGRIAWSPTKDRLIAEAHLGGVIFVSARDFRPLAKSPLPDCAVALAGCRIRNGKATGRRYGFLGWSPDGKRVSVVTCDCVQGLDGCEGGAFSVISPQ